MLFHLHIVFCDVEFIDGEGDSRKEPIIDADAAING